MALIAPRREVGEFRRRYKWMMLAVLLVFLGYAGRALQLQVIDHGKWARIAADNVTRTIPLRATRGVIRDAAQRVIADNRPVYQVFVTPQHLASDAAIRKLAELMDLSDSEAEAFKQRLAAVPARRRTQQIEMFSNINREQLAALETHAFELPGVDVVTEPARAYPYGVIGAHAVGYVNEVNADDLKGDAMGYRAGDRLGRTGVERAWEASLRGRDGFHRVFVDARGRRQDHLDGLEVPLELHREEIPGHDLALTLDMELMRAAHHAFRGHPSGAAVVVEVNTGKIRALYSKPAYNPNEMSGGLSAASYRALADNAFRPLLDKTVFETYFPGSTFKVVTALAALDKGLVAPTERIECPGFYELGRRRFRCGHAHGDVDMRKAIVQSCNVYFWKIAEKVGIDTINAYARDLGFGEVTGVGINGEARGFLAGRAWYEEKYGSRFLIGYTLNTAIGQGNTRVTPLQLALAYAAIANGGTLFEPLLVERELRAGGGELRAFAPKARRTLSVKPEFLALVTEGLVGVVNDQNGTAYEARIEGGVRVAGKTGTAQVAYRSARGGEDPKHSEYFRRDHAWFAGFGPVGAPELAVVVLVEHGGAGGKYAAPIALSIMEHALGDRRTSGPGASDDGATDGLESDREPEQSAPYDPADVPEDPPPFAEEP